MDQGGDHLPPILQNQSLSLLTEHSHQEEMMKPVYKMEMMGSFSHSL